MGLQWSAYGRGVLQLLAVQACAACGWAAPAGTVWAFGFCTACRLLLEPVPEGLGPPAPEAALFVYGGPMAEALRRFKYAGRYELARPLGALLQECAWAYAGLVERVVPLPLHPERLRARGYNQAALLAAPLARELRVPCDVGVLQRVRPTAVQAGLTGAAREANVAGAFRARRRLRPGVRVLLVDDVRTSGATLRQGAAALRKAGAKEVFTLALAQTDLES